MYITRLLDYLKSSDIFCICLVKTSYLQNFNVTIFCVDLFVPRGIRSVNIHDPKSMSVPPVDLYDTVSVFNGKWTWVTYISNILSNKTILFDILDFWCQLVVIRFVKTLSKRRMFVSSMKIWACWLLHRLIKFNKICWEKRPVKTRSNLWTSFCRREETLGQNILKSEIDTNLITKLLLRCG